MQQLCLADLCSSSKGAFASGHCDMAHFMVPLRHDCESPVALHMPTHSQTVFGTGVTCTMQAFAETHSTQLQRLVSPAATQKGQETVELC